MSEFVNTVDIVGDEALTNSIIDRSITEIADDIVAEIGKQAFYQCSSLTKVEFRSAEVISSEAFRKCSLLEIADFHVLTSIWESVFRDCSRLKALILRSENVTYLSNYALDNTPIKSGTGYIYVPRALVDSYKTYGLWYTVASKFRALEDYTVDGTTTGALDESKI